MSNNLYDVFGVLGYEQGSAQTPWRWQWQTTADEGLLYGARGFWLPQRGINIVVQPLGVHIGVIIVACLGACTIAGLELWDDWDDCEKECGDSKTPVTCWAGCIWKICSDNGLNATMCAACACCILAVVRREWAVKLCVELVKKIPDIFKK